MTKFTANVVLAIALVAPLVLFPVLVSRGHIPVLPAAAIAVLVGWALNVAWAHAAVRAAPAQGAQAGDRTVTIAARFGWLCPAVLVALEWAIWRFAFGVAA